MPYNLTYRLAFLSRLSSDESFEQPHPLAQPLVRLSIHFLVLSFPWNEPLKMVLVNFLYLFLLLKDAHKSENKTLQFARLIKMHTGTYIIDFQSDYFPYSFEAFKLRHFVRSYNVPRIYIFFA